MSSIVGIKLSDMLRHLKFSDYQNVYEPAEDTFLLIDAIVNDKLFLRIKNQIYVLKLVMELGVYPLCYQNY